MEINDSLNTDLQVKAEDSESSCGYVPWGVTVLSENTGYGNV